MAVNFASILSKQASAIEKPKPLPIGTYMCNNPALPAFKGIGKDETPCAEFGLIVLQPTDDVNPQELADYGDWKGKRVRHRMFLTELSEFRTKEELKNAFGIDDNQTLGQMFNETINKQVLVKIKHTPNSDGTDIFAEVESLAAV